MYYLRLIDPRYLTETYPHPLSSLRDFQQNIRPHLAYRLVDRKQFKLILLKNTTYYSQFFNMGII